jgi:predicted O-methyltransferase YrrM
MNLRILLLLGAATALGCAGRDPAPDHPRHEGKHHETRHHQGHGGHHRGHGGRQGGDHGGHHGGHKVHSAHHRFEDPERWAPVFESKERDRWQKPEAVLAALKLQPTMKAADIGAATGYFTVRLARALPQGKVWGVDIEPKMVQYLDRRAAKEGLAQRLVGVVGTATDAKIPEPVDLIFICNTYHHIGERTAYFKQLATKLSAGGRIAIVDFKLGKIPVGPPEQQRVPPEQLARELGPAGYKQLTLDTTTLPYQYIAIYARR